ncbi:uncharacterized protein LOC143921178 [Arctopsyche grandis]|uniref:uncharacterized protein LOC143921178 n=1 Tax=Arctopsyche grandis TaxID=121162 RepID=UPI00406D7390
MAAKSYIVDLRSDTLSRPTNSMRESMSRAVVGDDVYGEDPTVSTLEKKIAIMLGKQAALFVPSGTMANLISIMVHCNKRGTEVLVGDKSHIFKYEQGGASQIAGVMVTTLKNETDGTFNLEDMERHVRGEDIHEPKTTMVVVENTHNMCGGKVIPMDWIEKLATVAKKHSLILHMDGARLFNATQYLNEDPVNVVKHFDSISVCFSKSLGAPVGSAIVGSFSFIRQARRMRKVLGGGMRQAGVIAAPAIIALDEIVPALIGDHRRLRFLAEAINAMRSPTFTVDLKNLQTNILMLDIDQKCSVVSKAVVERLQTVTQGELDKGVVTQDGEGIIVKIIARDDKTLRVTTYYEISDIDINYTIKKMEFVFKEMECSKGFFG